MTLSWMESAAILGGLFFLHRGRTVGAMASAAAGAVTGGARIAGGLDGLGEISLAASDAVFVGPFWGAGTAARWAAGAPGIFWPAVGAAASLLCWALWRFRHRREVRFYGTLLAPTLAAAVAGGGSSAVCWGTFLWCGWFFRGLRSTAVVPYYAAAAVLGFSLVGYVLIRGLAPFP